MIYFNINGYKIEVKTYDNAAVEELLKKLEEGDITYTAENYGGFEKVGNLGFSLPQSDTQITTVAGDVMLYLGENIVLFYGSNTWAYTKIGKMQGFTDEELKDILSTPNEVAVTISLK